MEPTIKIDLVADWNPSIWRSLGFCPTFTVRRLLRTELESRLVKFVSRQQNEALNTIWKQVDEGLYSLRARVTECAAILNDRAIAILFGSPDQLEGEIRGENNPSYRDQLLVLFKNFSLIREEIQSSIKNPSGASFVVTRPIPVPKLRVTPPAAAQGGRSKRSHHTKVPGLPLPCRSLERISCEISVCILQRRARAGIFRRERGILSIPHLATGSNLLAGRFLGGWRKIG
jgi:hypothetical protein